MLEEVQHWPTRERYWGGLVHICEGECFGVSEGGGDMSKNSDDVSERWRRDSMVGLASADTLRAGSPVWKEMETGLKVEKWDPLSLCLGR